MSAKKRKAYKCTTFPVLLKYLMEVRMVVFKNQKLQVQGRVRIPEPILDHLTIKPGDSLDIILNKDKIVIQKSKNEERNTKTA